MSRRSTKEPHGETPATPPAFNLKQPCFYDPPGVGRERFHNCGIEVGSRTADDRGDRALERPSHLVGARRQQGVEDVGRAAMRPERGTPLPAGSWGYPCPSHRSLWGSAISAAVPILRDAIAPAGIAAGTKMVESDRGALVPGAHSPLRY